MTVEDSAHDKEWWQNFIAPLLSARVGYDIVASEYDHSPWAKFWDRNEFPFIKDYLASNAPYSNGLDIGCGTGRYSLALLNYCPKVTGVDISPEMVAIASRKNPNVRYVISDIAKFKPKTQYDVITCARVLSHIRKAGEAVSNICDGLLANDGHIIISDIHPKHQYTKTAFEVNGHKINLETYKHSVETIIKNSPSVKWTYKEFRFSDLRWKPGPNRFSTIVPEAESPIFFVLMGNKQFSAA